MLRRREATAAAAAAAAAAAVQVARGQVLLLVVVVVIFPLVVDAEVLAAVAVVLAALAGWPRLAVPVPVLVLAPVVIRLGVLLLPCVDRPQPLPLPHRKTWSRRPVGLAARSECRRTQL